LAIFLLSYKAYHDSNKPATPVMPSDNYNNSEVGVEMVAKPETKPTAPTEAEIQAKLAQQQAEQEATLARLRAPVMVVNQSNNPVSNDLNSSGVQDPNMRFLNQVAAQDSEMVQATTLGSLDWVIGEGRLIHAILETAINSDLPGYLRAIVNEPVYSEDGSRVLILPGSRLIGQFKSELQQGQARVFVVWTKILEPNGISISLGSPGVDALGRSGIGADSINRHFGEKFGNALLLSILGAGASTVGVDNADTMNASQEYRVAIAQNLAQTASNSINQNAMIPPTVSINPGKPIMVYVSRTLNFRSTQKLWH
jgi:type IV secretion system protein VirB10